MSSSDEKNNSKNPYVFLDLCIGDARAGRVVIELFKNKVPRTAENFRALCTGEKGIGLQGKPLHYKGSQILKVVPFCMIMGGDIISNDGTGGESIYGTSFDDEHFDIMHDSAGLVGMCNNGPNTNQSQFYITTMPCSQLDNTNVIFGKVVKGLQLIIDMADLPRENDKPLEPIRIENCGEFELDEPWHLEENDGTEDTYPPYPQDCEMKMLDNVEMENVIEAIRNSGAKKDPTNAKAFYRRAQAKLGMKDYEKAMDDLNTALNICPNDSNILSVLEVTKKIRLTYLKKEKHIFCKMFR